MREWASYCPLVILRPQQTVLSTSFRRHRASKRQGLQLAGLQKTGSRVMTRHWTFSQRWCHQLSIGADIDSTMSPLGVASGVPLDRPGAAGIPPSAFTWISRKIWIAAEHNRLFGLGMRYRVSALSLIHI